MQHALIELNPTDNVIAQIHSTLETGEGYTGDLLIGFYENSDVWIAREGNCVEIPLDALETVIKQLRRAKKLATKEQT